MIRRFSPLAGGCRCDRSGHRSRRVSTIPAGRPAEHPCRPLDRSRARPVDRCPLPAHLQPAGRRRRQRRGAGALAVAGRPHARGPARAGHGHDGRRAAGPRPGGPAPGLHRHGASCWPSTPRHGLHAVNVNLTPSSLIHPDLDRAVLGILEETGLPPEHLRIEVPETAAFADLAEATDVLRRITSAGRGAHPRRRGRRGDRPALPEAP